MAILTDIRELKTALEIDQDNTIEDVKLLFQIEWASALIEDYLDRRLTYDTRTEYYKGSNTQRLQLKSRPVFATNLQVYLQDNAYYGTVSGSFGSETLLTYGTDYCLDIDQPNGSSKSGILIKFSSVWPRINVRQRGLLAPYYDQNYGAIKVIYTAGYTVDTMPSPIRLACNLLVMKLRNIMPLGQEVGSESYEERHISYATRNKDYLMSLIKPILHSYRNWNF